MRQRQGWVITDVEKRNILDMPISGPVAVGTGDINWVCAGCDERPGSTRPHSN